MPHNPIFLQKRNHHILCRFKAVRKKNPKWTVIAVIEEVAAEVWLEPTTVGKILKAVDANIPTPKTIKKYCAEYLCA